MSNCVTCFLSWPGWSVWTILPRSLSTNVISTRSGHMARKTCYRLRTSRCASLTSWRWRYWYTHKLMAQMKLLANSPFRLDIESCWILKFYIGKQTSLNSKLYWFGWKSLRIFTNQISIICHQYEVYITSSPLSSWSRLTMTRGVSAYQGSMC